MLFYDLMWYNYPENKEYFKINPELTEWLAFYPKTKKELSTDIQSYENFINKYSKIFRYLPFIKNVYISNSVSFKSVHKNSDIDLFIVTENNRLFLSKFFVWLLFKILKIWWNHEKWKFCTWFWVTEQAVDLYPISIYPIDLYLAYRIAHLQPVYTKDNHSINNIFSENIRVKQIIPNYNWKYKKILNIQIIEWKNIFWKILEKVFWFDLINYIIWFFRKKRMIKWKKKLWKKWKNIIISDNILKFFAPDIRQTVYLKYKTLKPKFVEKKENQNWKVKNLTKKEIENEKLF